jgi:hypothetical protein
VLDRVKKEAVHSTHHTKDYDWETLAQLRTIARLCVLFKVCCGERAWNDIRDRLGRVYCLSGVDIFGILGIGSKERISGNIPL